REAPLGHEAATWVELLHAVRVLLGDVQVAAGVHPDAQRRPKLTAADISEGVDLRPGAGTGTGTGICARSLGEDECGDERGGGHEQAGGVPAGEERAHKLRIEPRSLRSYGGSRHLMAE